MNITMDRTVTATNPDSFHPFNPAWDDWPARIECRKCGLRVPNEVHLEPSTRAATAVCVWPERSPYGVRIRVAQLRKLRNDAELKLWVAASLDAAAQN